MARYGSTGMYGVGLLYGVMRVCTLYGEHYIIYLLCTICKLYTADAVPSPVLYAGYASTGSSAALVQFPC